MNTIKTILLFLVVTPLVAFKLIGFPAQNYYAELGVSSNASQAEIDEAYGKFISQDLVQKLHEKKEAYEEAQKAFVNLQERIKLAPADVKRAFFTQLLQRSQANVNLIQSDFEKIEAQYEAAQATIKSSVKKAYEILSDPTKRKQYDELLEKSQSSTGVVNIPLEKPQLVGTVQKGCGADVCSRDGKVTLTSPVSTREFEVKLKRRGPELLFTAQVFSTKATPFKSSQVTLYYTLDNGQIVEQPMTSAGNVWDYYLAEYSASPIAKKLPTGTEITYWFTYINEKGNLAATDAAVYIYE